MDDVIVIVQIMTLLYEDLQETYANIVIRFLLNELGRPTESGWSHYPFLLTI